jgi:hypothetical protein
MPDQGRHDGLDPGAALIPRISLTRPVRLGKVLAVDYLLAAHPDPDQPPNHAGPDGFDPAVAADDVPGVRLRLEQARHHVDVPDSYGVRLVLQADELLVVLGENVRGVLPPALWWRPP